MTDRVRHLTVTLDDDFREPDIEQITEAIMIRGVAHVEEGVVTSEER